MNNILIGILIGFLTLCVFSKIHERIDNIDSRLAAVEKRLEVEK